ncbi:MAG: hypothetical protein ACK4MQ_09915 [Hyphomonas sp.]
MTNTILPAADASLLAQQADEISTFLDHYIPAGSRVALLQFPYDGNVGMHMMWLAINDYLEARGVDIAYAAHEWNFNISDMISAVGDGAILFIGGVTVSRLWPGHAKVKRMVAAACPDNRLISLPSTMLFVDDDDRREAGAIFGDHRDVVLMARDPVSAESALEVFPPHISIPAIHDTTFLLPPQPRKTDPDAHDVLWLARDDEEGAGFRPPAEVKVFDWPDLNMTAPSVLMGRACSRFRRSVPLFRSKANAAVRQSYKAISQYVLSTGNRTLDTGRVLVTDRLHPHVLTMLRAQPSVLLPDRFGKNRAVWEYSSRAYSTVHWADTAEQALEIASALAVAERKGEG